MTNKKKAASKKKSISDFQPKQYKLEILNPATFEKTGGWILIVGMYSNEFHDATKLIKDKLLAQKEAEVDGSVDIKSVEFLEELDDQTIYGLSMCIVDWDVEFFESEFSQEKALEVLKDPTMKWLTKQIEFAIEKTSNFF